jgi:hypothetical protein
VLLVSTSSGTPNASNADANARHTARPVVRRTTDAITQYREWSSTPVTTMASDPSDRKTPPTMSNLTSAEVRGRKILNGLISEYSAAA